MALKLISEILEEASKIVKKSDRMDYLRKEKCPALTDILRINFDDSVVSLLPEGEPPFRTEKELPKGFEHTNLHKGFRKFGYFFKGPTANGLLPAKREHLFIELLESVHYDDAMLVILVKDKKLKVKGITKKMVKETFPNLIRK